MLGQAAEEQNKVLSLLKGAITEQLAESQHEGEATEQCVNAHFFFLSIFRYGDCN
jgi:hypothetical protein